MTHRVRVYPHNDLFNLAHYHREVINHKEDSGEQEALALDCMSCLIALAFAVEALVNFIGHKRITDWRERQPFMKKIELVCEEASLRFDTEQDPLYTVWQLKELRDAMAHGQPIEISTTAYTREELRTSMACTWDKNLNPKFVNHAYVQAKQLERTLFTNCGIKIGETVTSAVGIGV